MSQEQPKPSREDLAKMQDLFGLSHDLIAQASYPGHMGEKAATALKFLEFHYKAFESQVKAFDAAAKPVESVEVVPGVSVPAAQ